MKEYEVVVTYLNGCAGAAYPQTGFEEAEVNDPFDYIRAKHTKDFHRFVREDLPDGRIQYTFHNGTVCYIYEFTEL